MPNPRADRIMAKMADGYKRGGWAEPKPKSKKRKPSEWPTEYQEQMMVCDWLRAHRVLYFAVPNGAHVQPHHLRPQDPTRLHPRAAAQCPQLPASDVLG